MKPTAIEGVRYGRGGWSADTLYVGPAKDGSGETEITTPLQIIRLAAEQVAQLLAALPGELVTEYATKLPGDSMCVRPNGDWLENIYPLADWIRSAQRDHGGVWCRRVVVVEDWELVPPQPDTPETP